MHKPIAERTDSMEGGEPAIAASDAPNEQPLPPAPEGVTPAIWSTLRSCRVLEAASDPTVAWLSRVSTQRSFHKGDRISWETSGGRELGIVVTGHVRVVHFGADGRPVTVHMSWPGDPIGMLAALAGDEFRATFESATNDTSLVTFPLEAFMHVLRDEPDTMMSVIRELARQSAHMVTMVQTLSADVPSRVAIYIGLLLEAQEPRGNGPFDVYLGVTRVELAAQLGTVPETLSRAFHALQNDKVIAARGQHVTVLDREALIARSNGVL